MGGVDTRERRRGKNVSRTGGWEKNNKELLWKNQKQNWGCGSGDCSDNLGDEEEESLEGPRTGMQHGEVAAERKARKRTLATQTSETGEEGMQGGYGHDAEE